MKAVILAGGEGRRLRPLTERLPKPLLPLPDRPVIDYILYRLAKAGITEAAVTLGFMGKTIREKLGDSRHGVSLTYYEEKVARGTAGSVKGAEDFLDEDFLVLCGDGMFDFDLPSCIAAHEKSNADVTLILTHHPRPREYGVVLCDPADRVIRFLEKPDWTQTFSDTVNTGIYLCKKKILSRIPENVRQDFSMDVFPRLLQDGYVLRGHLAKGYWCDIGSPASYYRCVRDALDGKIADVPLAESRRNLYKAGNGYYYQADGVVRGEDTVVTAGSVISEGCRLLRGSMADGAILFPDVTLHEDCRVDRSILSAGVSVGRESRLREGVVMGENCRVDPLCSIPSGTVYPADSHIRYSGGQPFSDSPDELFDVDGIPLTLSTEQAVRIGRAAALATDEDHVFIMHGISCEETLLANEIAAGVMLAGKVAKRLGEGQENLAAFAAVCFHAPLLIHVSASGEGYKAILLDRYGLPLSNMARRRIEQIYTAPFPPSTVGKSENVCGVRELYLSSLTAGAKLLAGETFFVSLGRAGDLLTDALTTLSAAVVRDRQGAKNAPAFTLSDDGKTASLTLGNETYDFAHLLAALLQAEAECGTRSFAIPYLAPRIYDEILAPYGAAVYRYLSVGNEFEQEARALASVQPYMRDGVTAVIKLLSHFSEKDGLHLEKLRLALQNLPPFCAVEETFTPAGGDKNKAAILTRLSLAGGKGKEGITFSTGNGFIALTPRMKGYRIIAQSYSTEAANELCADMKGKIQSFLEGKDAAK